MIKADGKHDLLRVIESLPDSKVLVVGDLMLDVYWSGEVNRISPEAPVPVVNLQKRTVRPGGAGNVAVNIAALGGKAHLVACLGSDPDGLECAGLLELAGLTTDLVWCKERQTSVKTRILSQNQQIVRLDRECGEGLPTETAAQVLEIVRERAKEFSHIILSDYNKGVVTRELVRTLIKLGKKVIIDPKPQHAAWYKGAYLLTPNALEAKVLSANSFQGDSIWDLGISLRRELELEYLLATLGADGMALVDGEKVVSISSLAQQVFDVTGAGDTVIATLTLALAAGNAMLPSCIVANYAAGVVVEKVGAAHASLPELLRSFRLYEPEVVERKISEPR